MDAKNQTNNFGLDMCLVAALASFVMSVPAYSGVFVHAYDAGYDTVTHPEPYTGSASNLTISIGIDPTSAHKDDMVNPLKNVIEVWNDLNPTTGNLVTGTDNKVDDEEYDFESAALHEAGHTLGLAHPNLGSTAPTPPASNKEYTQSVEGPNLGWDFNAGTDGIIGSSDDERGDDVNLHWFRIKNNNPFTLDATVDSST